MIADGKTSFSGRLGFCCTRITLILMFVRGVSQAAVSVDRQNRNRTADVVRHQQKFAVRR